ncbi:phenylacetate--CoA ligase family protein [Leptobacterium flavescens]|uniref:Phenylacetate--CoA ligase family protein n=1 Tax=Leptobacterium flavescens TaxID=472055 RepID=A0A6P0UHR3_9FLAO|nr:phenylacetate--CoA ligase family protein [Leptobacterium flavescens]NER12162.1 phenylacetate--CoA ligase family protein [Leptobacterium flavescens]
MLYKTIFKIGQNRRNPSIDGWYDFLKKTEEWPLEKLETYQFQKLKEILSFAYEYSPYYRRKFEAAKLNPDDLKTINDLSKFPVLTKEDVLTHNEEIHTRYDFKKRFRATTSGSSGNSLAFWREEKADSFNRATIFRGYSWYNVNPWDKNGYFWGFNFSGLERFKIWFLDLLQNRFRIFSYEERAFRKFARKLESASFVHGYSSMIYESAKIINQKKLRKPKKIKLVKGTSEKIMESYKEEIKKAFNVPIISEYGATESGIMAFECPEGNMHITMEGVVIEELDNEILVTNLQLRSFPFIRYKLGDYIKLAPREKKCPCGREHLILEEVTGRIGENVYGKKNIYPSFYFYYIFKNLFKHHNLPLTYLVVQREKGQLEFNIEESLNAIEEKYLRNEINKYFEEDISYEIRSNYKKDRLREKTKSFISYI